MIFDKIRKKDYFNFIFQWLFSGVIGLVVNVLTENTIDVVFIFLLISILYLVCEFYAFRHYYIFQELGFDIHSTINKATLWYCILLVLCAIGHLLPYNVHLFLVAGAVLCSILPKHLGLAQSMMIVFVIQLCGNTNVYELLYSVMLVLFGMMCSTIFEKKKYSFESALIICGISFVIYFLCNYSTEPTISIYMVLHGFIESVINMGLLILAVPYLIKKSRVVETKSYGEAIEDDFSMVLELKTISMPKYLHGRTVSLLCYKCGKLIGVNENLACCGGLYYCLNDSDIDNPIEHVTEMGEKHNLPLDVRRLLQQYHGIKQQIASPEAALVDLIDEVVSRLEEKGISYTTGFNRQMLIMSTFEELSASGRYDASGLSINMFLKIRKYLMEEADFNENIFRK